MSLLPEDTKFDDNIDPLDLTRNEIECEIGYDPDPNKVANQLWEER